MADRGTGLIGMDWVSADEHDPEPGWPVLVEYLSGDVVAVTRTAAGEWKSADIDNLMPPLGGRWKYDRRKRR